MDLNQYRVFFFGSRVSDTVNDRSDIDLGLEGPEKIQLSVLAAIKEAFRQLPTMYSFDVVDFKNVKADFKKVALQDIEELDL